MTYPYFELESREPEGIGLPLDNSDTLYHPSNSLNDRFIPINDFINYHISQLTLQDYLQSPHSPIIPSPKISSP